MKKYRVSIYVSGQYDYEIEADTPEAAEDAAFDMYEDGDNGVEFVHALGDCNVQEIVDGVVS